MNKVVLLVVGVLALGRGASAQKQQLYGTWRLVSAVTTVVATGEKYDRYGKDPRGYITYGPEGRMQVLITNGPRTKPGHEAVADMTDQERNDLMMTMTAYSGTYDFDGKTVTHHIDTSWNEVWSGTDQIRDVRIDAAGRAIFTTRPTPDNKTGKVTTTTLVWEKMK
jgi:lipocalin-like protein